MKEPSLAFPCYLPARAIQFPAGVKKFSLLHGSEMMCKYLIENGLQAATNAPTQVFPVFSLPGREVGRF
jgi:hypothetical protein